MIDVASFGEPMVEFCATDVGRIKDVYIFRRGWGGDTSNFIVAVARLGVKAGYICRIGNDEFGKSFLELWHNEGIDVSQVIIEEGGFTAVYFISLLPGGGHDFTYYRKNSAASHFSPSDLNPDYLSGIKVFHSSGISMAISESCRETVFKAVEIVKANGGIFSFDVNFRPKLWPPQIAKPYIEKIMVKADLIFMSKEDASLLYGDTETDKIIKRIYSFAKPKVFVIKMGGEGCLILNDKEKIDVPSFKVNVVDTTGAGDAFDGAFIVGLLEGKALEEIGIFANAVGALTTTALGAVAPIPRRRDVEDFLRSFKP
ncbi:MAG: sugar kinase [Candidatus Bathyarchaeia archaeon]|nr:sugar kinase [Candidatus Bathyarchaeota archaeon]